MPQRFGRVSSKPDLNAASAGTPSLLHGAAVVLVALLAVACGSDDGAGANNDGKSPVDNEDVVGDPIGYMPCEGFNTGYESDDVCIKPPPDGKGFQLRYGPANYDDEGEVEKYLLYPGEEKTDCFYTHTPNTEEVWVSEYHGRLRKGSHHMITFTMKEPRENPADGPEECLLGGGWSFLVGAQEAKTDVSNAEDAPELAGHALRIKPNTPAAIQAHFYNIGDKPLLREAWVNTIYMDPNEVEVEIAPLFWIGGFNMKTPPKTNEVVKGECRVRDGAPENLKLIQVTGHYHSHTKLFTAWKVDGATGDKIKIYESDNYNDPGFTHFNTKIKNPAPGPGKVGSDHNGELFLKAGDRVEWECHVENNEDFALEFGNAVHKYEMCNVFGVSAPNFHSANSWDCVNTWNSDTDTHDLIVY